MRGGFPATTAAAAAALPAAAAAFASVAPAEGGTGTFTLSAPLDDDDPRAGTQRAVATGREAATSFRLLGWSLAGDGSSVVECWPHTGRTHQIRVHLALLGAPIGNDAMYGGSIELARGPAAAASAAAGGAPAAAGAAATATGGAPPPGADAGAAAAGSGGGGGAAGAGEGSASGGGGGGAASAGGGGSEREDWCDVCTLGEEACFSEEQLHSRGIWLHAVEYAGAGWSYAVPLPAWAATS